MVLIRMMTMFQCLIGIGRGRLDGPDKDDDQDVKEVTSAIGESKPVDVHPDLYSAVMDQGGFNPESLMAALSHLLNNKAQGVGFVAMADAHGVLWLRIWLGKHYY
jgi:hypothetical protein